MVDLGCRALGTGFSSTEDFLVPEVEPAAGFYYFSIKQVELSRDNSQMVERAPWLPGGVCPPGPSGEEAGGHPPSPPPQGRGQSSSPRQARPAEAEAEAGCLAGRRGTCPGSSRLPRRPFVALSGEEPTLSRESRGWRTSSVPMGCVAGRERRPPALLLSGASGGWAAHVQGAHPPFKHRGPEGNHTLPFQTWPWSRAQRQSYNQVASVHFITEGCGV